MSREIMTMKQSWKSNKQVNLFQIVNQIFQHWQMHSRDRYSCEFYDQFENQVEPMITNDCHRQLYIFY
jgi:hypothetical protein